MAEYVGIGRREMFDMRAVGIGERVERHAFGGALQHGRDAWHFAGEERVPAFQELGIRDADPEQVAQACKEFGVVVLAFNGIMDPRGLRAQLDIFANAARHLALGGYFIVEPAETAVLDAGLSPCGSPGVFLKCE